MFFCATLVPLLKIIINISLSRNTVNLFIDYASFKSEIIVIDEENWSDDDLVRLKILTNSHLWITTAYMHTNKQRST